MRESGGLSGDIELDISRGPGHGHYVVRVLQAPAGTSAPSSFELDVDSLLADRMFLESVVLASAVRSRRSMPLEEQQIQKIGQTLFGALFSREIYGTYRASQAAAHQSGHQLRVVLTLSAPELAALPWEALYDPETETYLCRTEPLVRRISAPAFHLTPLRIERPLRVLGIVSDPADLPPLDAAAERQNLEQALAGGIAAGHIEIVWVTTPTWSNIHEALLNGPWHVIHFIGHGEFNGHADEGQLVLINHEGNADSVEANRLVDLLSTARPIPRLVVLNSCSSGETGAQDLFSSTAAALVRGGIHAVTAMQFAISDEGAIAFAQGFYSALATGRSVDEAARNGRIAIRGRTGGTLEWITPVLYVRQGPTQLFTIPATTHETGSWQSPEPRTVATLRSKEDLHTTYVRAQAELRVKNYGAAVALLDDVLQRDPGYRDAAALHAEAARINQPIEAYEKALTAESNGDLAEAERLYSVVLSVDPGFRDAEERKQKCNTRQRINDLQAEISFHASAERWQAVLDTSAELQDLDPAAADPDGMATHAQMEIYWAEAQAAEAAGDLHTAYNAYMEIMEKDPQFRDTAERMQAFTKKQRVKDLQAEIREHASSERWRAVLDATAELVGLDPAATDPDGMATHAQMEIYWAEAQVAEAAGDLHTAHNAYREIMEKDPQFRDVVKRWMDRKRDLEGQLISHHSMADKAEPENSTVVRPEDDTAGEPSPHDVAGLGVRSHKVSGATGGLAFRAKLLTTRTFESEITAVCFSPDGTLMATSERKGYNSTHIWDVVSGAKLHTLKTGFASFDALAFSPDSRWVAGISFGRVQVFSVSSGKVHVKFRSPLNSPVVKAFVFRPDGERFVTVDSGGSLVLWSIATGRAETRRQLRDSGWISAASFSSDGVGLAAVDPNGTTDLWDTTTCRRIAVSPSAWKERNRSPVLAVSPDGKRIAAIVRNGMPSIWNGTKWIGLRGAVNGHIETMTFNGDATVLAISDVNEGLSFWDIESGELVVRVPDLEVNLVAFSSDDVSLVICQAKKLSVWKFSYT